MTVPAPPRASDQSSVTSRLLSIIRTWCPARAIRDNAADPKLLARRPTARPRPGQKDRLDGMHKLQSLDEPGGARRHLGRDPAHPRRPPRAAPALRDPGA